MYRCVIWCVLIIDYRRRLRLTALNEEIGLQEHGTGEGDTYTDVMKDFSQRLQRSPKNESAPSTNEAT